jgi:hypothetical protein
MHAPEDVRVEPRLQLVERPVVRSPHMLTRDDGDGFVGERCINDLIGLHQKKALADFDGEPLLVRLPFGDELDNLLQLGIEPSVVLGIESSRVLDIESGWTACRTGPNPAGRFAVQPNDLEAPAGALHRQLEPRLLDRLEQVIDGVHLERLDSVLIVRRHENDVRPVLRVEHPPRHFESGQAGHLHVQKDDVGLQPVDRRKRFDAVAGLADYLDAPELLEQVPELVPRQLFVVDHDRAQIHLTP